MKGGNHDGSLDEGERGAVGSVGPRQRLADCRRRARAIRRGEMDPGLLPASSASRGIDSASTTMPLAPVHVVHVDQNLT